MQISLIVREAIISSSMIVRSDWHCKSKWWCRLLFNSAWKMPSSGLVLGFPVPEQKTTGLTGLWEWHLYDRPAPRGHGPWTPGLFTFLKTPYHNILISFNYCYQPWEKFWKKLWSLWTWTTCTSCVGMIKLWHSVLRSDILFPYLRMIFFFLVGSQVWKVS